MKINMYYTNIFCESGILSWEVLAWGAGQGRSLVILQSRFQLRLSSSKDLVEKLFTDMENCCCVGGISPHVAFSTSCLSVLTIWQLVSP